MEAIRSIVAGVDFSSFSDSALSHAARMARAHGARLHAIHVIEELVLFDLENAIPQREGLIRKDVLASSRKRL